MSRFKKLSTYFLMVLTGVIVVSSFGFSAEDVEKYIPSAEAAEKGMTLWQIIVAGGEVMVVLALLSIAALGLIVYYFLTMKQNVLFPEGFQEEVIPLVEGGRYEEARKKCQGSDNLLAGVLSAGLARIGRDKIVIKEAIQDEGRRRIDDLRQKLSYLADVAAISPMVGLLGTVLGMIQAFNVIAFQTGAVKPILLASGISKAMVTTATGLIIAIPAMIFYSFFKGKVQNYSARLEDLSTELFHLITEK
ncbi:MAG: MotA/TolQ/ExbB proton channel family protein [Candidatus Omnitrophica bacterium]|nr:MotA/TolQ/ExbB proton channel family protein [Candidatus Omnitrophota bacterium]